MTLSPNQIEVLSAEQALEAYSSSGMALMYGRWTLGRHFAFHERHDSRGLRGLAFAIVFNRNAAAEVVHQPA